MAQQAYKGDVLQRIAGIALILGGVFTIVFNVLLPRPDDPTSISATLAKLAEHPTLGKLSSFGLAIGIWLLVIGIAGIYRSIASGAGSAWARLGFYGVLVGASLFTTTFALVNAATLAAQHLPAGGAAAAAAAAVGSPIVAAANSVNAMSIVVFWLALAFLGLGISLSAVYPKWIGWALLVLGIATVVVSGVPAIFATPTKNQSMIFAALAGLSSLLVLVIGIWITRREMKAMKAT